MRRSELIEAVQELRQALEDSKVADSLKSIRNVASTDSIPPPILSDVLTALAEYLVRARNFKSATQMLTQVFNLEYLSDPSFWSKLFEGQRGPEVLFRILRDINFVTNYLPIVAELLSPEDKKIIVDAQEKGDPKFLGKDLLTVVLIEETDRFSKPIRLRNMLESVEILYDACVIITESRHDSLSVISCDSGSDKSFDFFGAAKVLECVKEIIISLWDRVVFYREYKLSERMDLISKSLPIMDKISELERQERIGPEQAELLRRNIVAGVNGFIESGATIPELEQRSHFNPRLLMSPAPKLLTGSRDIEADPDTPFANSEEESSDNPPGSGDIPVSSVNDLDETEREELFRLLQKTRRNKKNETDPT